MGMKTKKRQAGFSLIEALAVMAVIGVLAGMAVIGVQNAIPSMKANSAVNQVVGIVRRARHLAISDRRTITVNFVGNNQIQLFRLPPNAANGGVPVAVDAPITLEGGLQFVVFPGVPDTPMGFGNSTALSFVNTGNPKGGGLPTTQFLADGTFSAAINSPVNGTIFLGIPGKSKTARAVTILGATGRIRSYYFDGSAWQQ